jgi:hypothetical protein
MMEFDTDPEAAAKRRVRTFDMVIADDLLVSGMHLHFPGFAYLTKAGDGYRLIAEQWAFQA